MFNEIAKNFPNIQFTWIGDGELRSELTSKNIVVTGWLERKEVLKYLNDSDIFILPSLWEGLPISLLEAMYMKKICIVSDVIGNKNVIQHKINGFIFHSVDDIKEIIESIKVKGEASRIIENAYKNVLSEYNVKQTVDDYKKIYETIKE